MTYSSSLTDNLTPLVLDTSVLINVHASRRGDRILDALPNEVLVPEIVASELEHEASKTKAAGRQFIQHLVVTRRVRLVALNDSEHRLFGSLVSGSASLGDGEAATIAVGVRRHYLPVVDERKGRHRAEACLSGKHPGWSIDLLRHPRVVAALGTRGAADAVYLALRDGRMRIAEADCDIVVSLIGVRRALECNSLPGYKASGLVPLGIGSACRLQPRAGEVAERLADHAVDRVQVEVAVVLRIAELSRPVPAGCVDPGRRPPGCGTCRPRPAAAGCWGRSGARPVSWASGGSTGPQAASTSGPERYSFMSAANSSQRPSLSTSPSANAIVL